MSSTQVSDAFDLLGQTDKWAPPLRLQPGQAPKLNVEWGSFRQSLGSSVLAVVGGPSAPKKLLDGEFFRDCSIERHIPRRAVIAAGLWHLVFLAMPWGQFPETHKNPALENVELTWSGPINDLPLLEIPGAKSKPSPVRGEIEKLLPREGADAFHPRQRIFTDPEHPTHPRQLLINSAAAPQPPKILPNLPNIVLLQTSAAPARPRLEISAQTLASLHPRERHTAATAVTPLPDVPTVVQTTLDLNLPAPVNKPERPKLELNVSTAPRVTQRTQTADPGLAPELANVHSNSANPSTLIALSATPAAPSNIAPPQGNLAARIAVSPEGTRSGVPGGTANGTSAATGGTAGAPVGRGSASATGAGSDVLGVSISGGNPTATSETSGLGAASGKINLSSPRILMTRPDPHAALDDLPARAGPPNFAALPPGTKPEQIFASKKVYTLYVNMPNLNSATGSWVLNFSELRTSSNGLRMTSPDLNGPTPLRKVDPKYPNTLINEHVEGEIVLYAVIRQDGSIDSIQLVHGLDEQLDANAMHALSQWKFSPASKEGAPIDLEAIVHIPFHAPTNR
ncbi:MAG TPA: TonB family protein [Candidatus Dormibacteraeota bacterium]|nr:TonB family protein [Candidatus Dormibacteraeota bacterium]